ncbi:MAG: hypothetical protein WCP18_02260 [bacterium]
MFLTVHAAASAYIGKKVPNVFLAFIVAFFFHFIFDMIPHGDEKLGRTFLGFKIREHEDFKFMAMYGSVDTFFMAMFLLFLFKNFQFARDDSVIWAIIGGILPDILVALSKLTNNKFLNWFANKHMDIHHYLMGEYKVDVSLKTGMILQFFLMILIVWMLGML